MEQADASPDVVRLSDEHETRLSLALASTGSTTERAGRAYLRMRGHEGGCLAIVGFEGDEDEVERRRLHTGALLRGGGGLRLGRRPGEAWLRSRYAGPYLRDALLDQGVFVETLETATSWSNLPTLYAAVVDALRRSLLGARHAAAGHVPRVAPVPLRRSLYFTFLARQQARGRAGAVARREDHRLRRDRRERGDDHPPPRHRPGHAPRLSAEVGPVGVDLIRAAKERLDPAGIMNPGKLLP